MQKPHLLIDTDPGVDDALAIHHDAMSALLELNHYFIMKKGSIGDPNIYLGAKLRQVTLDNGVVAWSASPSKYVQDAVRIVKKCILNSKAMGRN